MPRTQRVLRDRIRAHRKAAATRRAAITRILRTTRRPHSLTSHLINLAGADPLTARMFKESSCDAAIKRLGLTPVAKVRKRRTITGRHVIVAAPVRNKQTGKIEIGQKNVRRRGTGRSRRRQGTTTITVHHWTVDQAAAILGNTNPRKVEYKQLKADALDAYAVITANAAVTPRRLPRHRKWSKRR